MAERQALGMLPTWHFWNDMRNTALAAPFLAVTTVGVVAVAALTSVLTAELVSAVITGGLVGALAPLACLGLVERHVRRRARTRTRWALPLEH